MGPSSLGNASPDKRSLSMANFHSASTCATPIFGLMLLVGCTGQPSRIAGVEIDVKATAERIIGEFDKDQNGNLSSDELTLVPAVNANRKWYDADRDGQVSQEELRKGLRDIFNPKDGLLSVACEVTRNGQPLSGAQVKFVPMPELEGAIPPASGVTDDRGSAFMNIADPDRPPNTPPRVPVVRPGLYLVEVTHDQI